MVKLKAYLWTLERYFALPFFGGSLLLGVALAGGSFASLNTWLAFIMGTAFMCAGHVWNSALDYHVGLDKGEIFERSAEKNYSGGQSLIASGTVTIKEVVIIAVIWDLIGLGTASYLATNTGWQIILIALLCIAVPFAYTPAKFSYFHELVLFVGAGPLAALIGMYSVTPAPEWWIGIAASAPSGLILSFVGLPLDEWEDAEANLKKGVKSVAYRAWEYNVDLGLYLLVWVAFVYLLQVFLITVGILAPLTWLTFVLVPVFMAAVVFLKKSFRKTAGIIVIIGACYPVLMLIGQIFGG